MGLVMGARLAGLPSAVVDRARDILAALESGAREGGAKPAALIDDLPLFRASPPAAPAAKVSAAEARLREITPDTLTPREALELVYELVGLVDVGRNVSKSNPIK